LLAYGQSLVVVADCPRDATLACRQRPARAPARQQARRKPLAGAPWSHGSGGSSLLV